jgi:hypothetical protein
MAHDPFDLARQHTFAALSPTDLEGLGKRASHMFLSYDVPLNDAVVKLAQECPGISSEQIKRVVEFANRTTYQHLFEKQAGDKNVEFQIADPSEVLRRINSSASAPIVKMAAPEYGMSPERWSRVQQDLQADIAIMRMFGVEPSSEALTKVAQDPGGQPDLTDSSQFLQQMPPGDTALQKGIEYALAEKARGDGIGNYDALASVLDAVKNTAQTMSTQPNPKEILKAQEQAAKAQAKGMAGMDAGAAGGGGAMGAPQAAPAPGPVEMGGAAPPMPEAPPNAQGMKIASILQEAEAYIRLGRPDSPLVFDDLVQATSLDVIKQATASRADYPQANPFGDLIRAWHTLNKLAEEAAYAQRKNEALTKEAQADFSHHVVQHVLGGGNLGEVAHLMGAIAPPEIVKVALEGAIPELTRRGLDPARLQTASIRYEMEKSASARVPNTNHPIAHTFAAFVKLAEGQAVLDEAVVEVETLLKEAEAVIKQAGAWDALGKAVGAVGGAAKRLLPGANTRATQAVARELGVAAPKGPGMLKRVFQPGAAKVEGAISKVEAAPLTAGPRAMSPEVASGLAPHPKLPAATSAAPALQAAPAAATAAPEAATQVAQAAPAQGGGLGRRLKYFGTGLAVGGMGGAGFARGFGTQNEPAFIPQE